MRNFRSKESIVVRAYAWAVMTTSCYRVILTTFTWRSGISVPRFFFVKLPMGCWWAKNRCADGI
ncbi:MAG: hypothetical protein II935_12130 [Bacteroidales bacterium]|nr:hypothetical protein [Bacteroidales bacterium]